MSGWQAASFLGGLWVLTVGLTLVIMLRRQRAAERAIRLFGEAIDAHTQVIGFHDKAIVVLRGQVSNVALANLTAAMGGRSVKPTRA